MAEAPRCNNCLRELPSAETATCPTCGAPVERGAALRRLWAYFFPSHAPLTRALAGVMLAVWLVEGLATGGGGLLGPSLYTSLLFGASFGPSIVEGEVWRLLTATLLHGDPAHLLFNLSALRVVGPLAESAFGRGRTLALFVATGLGSTLGTLLWGLAAPNLYARLGLDPGSATSFGTVLVGMSGSLTGLVGAGISAGQRIGTAHALALRAGLVRWMGFTLLFGLMVPNVGNAAHVAGFAVGLGLGAVFPLGAARSTFVRRFSSWGGGLAGGLLAASAALHLAFWPWGAPADLDFYPAFALGMKRRDADRDDPRVLEAQRGCLDAVRTHSDPEVSEAERAAALQEARARCDELALYLPTVPQLRYVSAAVQLEQGDHARGCRRLEGVWLLARLPNADDELREQLAQTAQEHGCTLWPSPQ
jgi:rhomboid protease GluP